MNRLYRLYEKLREDPNVSLSFRDLITLIEAFGFEYQRTRGSHRAYFHPACPRPLILQPDGKDAKRYQVRQFLDMVEDYKLKLNP